ncbi:phytoene/squalene synthase family protein [Brachybacterium epidermidis]
MIQQPPVPHPHAALDARAYTAAAVRAADRVIDAYSTSFGSSTRLLGTPVRGRVRSIYALVRVADEIVDGAAEGCGLEPDAIAAALEDYETRTEQALASGFSSDLVVHAFARTARACGIGPELTRPFFASMRADLTVSEHDPFSFEQYVYGSAEVVGLMCLHVFTTDRSPVPVAPSPTLLEGARRLGAAFQKVNFLRDLRADAVGRGRSYFPGVDPATLTDRQKDELLIDIQADLAAAREAIVLLPDSSRTAVRAVHDLFAALTDRLAATDAGELRTGRVRIPDARKAAIIARAALQERGRGLRARRPDGRNR